MLMKYLNKIVHLKRTGWLLNGIINCETDADHMFGTMILALFFDDIVRGSNRSIDKYDHNKIPILLIMLSHDLQEAMTGDFTYRTKEYLKTPNEIDFKDLEDNAFTTVIDSLPDKSKQFFKKMYNYMNTPEDDKLAWYRIIDIVEMLIQAYEYEKMRLGTLTEFWYYNQDEIAGSLLCDFVNVIKRKRDFIFFNRHQSLAYQQYESTIHHSSSIFAQKFIELDRDKFSARDRAVKRYFENWVGTRDTVEVLDVGCGLCSFSRYFLESTLDQNVTVTGIDINASLLREANNKWKSANFKAKKPMDIGWYWDIESDIYDIIMMGEVLEHLFNPEHALSEANRTLKPGGLLFLSVPNSFCKEKKYRFNKEHRVVTIDSEHIRFFSINNLTNIIIDSGFDIDDVVGLNKEWSKEHSIKPFSTRKARPYWTLMVIARKKRNANLEDLKDENQFTISDLSKIHATLEKIYKAKLLTIDNAVNNTTIAQQTFLVSFYTMCFAIELDLDIEAAVKFCLLNGIIETGLAEMSPEIRSALSVTTREKVLCDMLEDLPRDMSKKYIETYCSLINERGLESLIPQFLLYKSLFGYEASRNNMAFAALFSNKKFMDTLKAIYCDM